MQALAGILLCKVSRRSIKNRMQILVFGAGCIGRGLLGELSAQAGMSVAFAEAYPPLAENLAKKGSFKVTLTGRERSETTVSGYSVLSPNDSEAIRAEIAQCEFAATAVGGRRLLSVASVMAPALTSGRKCLPILLCENQTGADRIMRDALLEAGAEPASFKCIPCSVERMVRGKADSLDLVGESVETAWAPVRLPLPGINYCERIEPYYARKLYTNNAGHAVLAYEGFLAGVKTIVESISVPEIKARVVSVLEVAARMLEMEYDLNMSEHLDSLIKYRFANEELADTVSRVARQPIRKLGPGERLVGLLRKLELNDLPIDSVCRTIAAALCYESADDSESLRMREIIRRSGPGAVLTRICGMRRQELSYRLCVENWNSLSGGCSQLGGAGDDPDGIPEPS